MRASVLVGSLYSLFFIWACSSTQPIIVQESHSTHTDQIFAADSTYFQGYWSGDLRHKGMHIPMGLNISTSGITLDNPSQNLHDYKISSFSFSENDLILDVNKRVMTLIPRGQNKALMLMNMPKGITHQITMYRDQELSELDRPQYPTDMSSYQSDSVIFVNEVSEISLAGTLTLSDLPNNKQPSALAILLTGSGPQDRDETLLGHKSFAVIADHLTKAGMGVLRYDDRGVGQSEGSQFNATSFDFATDAQAAYNFLQSEYRKIPIGFIGHSEGGIIAQIADSLVQGAAFHIYLAGPGLDVINLMVKQNEQVLENILSKEDVQRYIKRLKPLFEVVVNDWELPKKQDTINHLARALYNSLDPEDAQKIAPSDMVYAMSMNGLLYNQWMLYFLKYEPRQYLSQINCPILALNGSKDIQVDPANLEAIQEEATNSDVTTLQLEGLNHLFQKCNSCSISEYGMLTETFSTEALEAMVDWLIEKELIKK